MVSDLAAPFIATSIIDDVTLATTTTVTGINWSGIYSRGDDNFVAAQDDNFEIRIHADNGGSPGALLQTFAVGNNVNRTTGINRLISGVSTPSFDFSAGINFTFDAGVTQWISVLNNSAADNDFFSHNIIDAGGNAFGSLPSSNQFIAQSFITDFQLTSVPEPGSVGILALGLMGLLSRRKRS